MTKSCWKCSSQKTLDQFHRDRTKSDGFHTICRECRGCKPRDIQPPGFKRCGKCKEPKPFKEFSGGNRTKNGLQSWCKSCVSTYLKDWFATPQGRLSQEVSRIKTRYGLEEPQYLALKAGQGGLCAICKIRPPRRRLAVDHDHATGKVRGLLCSTCNAALGMFHDDPAILTAAIYYLASPPAPAILSKL